MEKPNPTIREIFGVRHPKKVGTSLPTVKSFNGKQLVGIEIEVEGCRRSQDWYTEVLSPPFAVTTDASLRGDAFEFISSPMTIENIIPEITRFFAVTDFTDENFSDRCSIHVHANVCDFTKENVAALCLVYQTVEDILFNFVGHDRDTNLYCVPWNQCRMNYLFIEDFFHNPVNKIKVWQKYTALNLLPISKQGTVEFRHMHGTSDRVKIVTWIHLIGNMMMYAKEKELDEVIDLIKDLNTSSNYHTFFESIFRGVIPYNEDYRASLENGVISAKYALMDWSKEKKGVKKEAYPTIDTNARIMDILGLGRGTPLPLDNTRGTRPAPQYDISFDEARQLEEEDEAGS